MSVSLTVKRRVIQWVAAVLLTTNVQGIGLGRACIPILYCEACSLTWLGCPIGIMATSIAFHEIPWLVLAIVLGSAVIVGRWFCGWICPTGLVQDLLFKIPTPKLTLPRWTRFIKYGVCFVAVVGVAYVFTKENPYFFCSWCPTATVMVGIPEAIQFRAWEFSARWVVLALVILLAILNHRSFCKVLCPVGAMVALASRFSWLSIRMDAPKCIRCKQCDRVCPMDGDVEACKDSGKRINDNAECVNCLECEAVCPKGAISNNSRILKA